MKKRLIYALYYSINSAYMPMNAFAHWSPHSDNDLVKPLKFSGLTRFKRNSRDQYGTVNINVFVGATAHLQIKKNAYTQRNQRVQTP